MEIGNAIVNYDSEGKLIEVSFTPTMKITLTNAEAARLAKIDGTSEETIESTATLALAAWFQRTNEIELTDRAISKIVAKVKDCIYWSNGKTKQCIITFNFERNEKVI